MKKFFVVALFFFSFLAFAQTPPRPSTSEQHWRLLEKATVAFDSGEYNEALRFANRAKESRKMEVTWQLYVLNRATTPADVKREGEEFRNVLRILKERDENVAVGLIQDYLDKYGEEFFNDSISKMISWIKESKVYPEADYLLGKIYQLEGEYDLAHQYFEEARENSDYLDIPDEKYDILYSMADLAYDRKDEKEFEEILVLILNDNLKYQDKNFIRALYRTIDANKQKEFHRFFSLYRCELDESFKALFLLMNFEEERGDIETALKCAATASISVFTHILESLQSRNPDFSYATFDAFLAEIAKYDDIVYWCEKNNIWELFFRFINLSAKHGSLKFAGQGFLSMKECCPNSYWKAESGAKLSSF